MVTHGTTDNENSAGQPSHSDLVFTIVFSFEPQLRVNPIGCRGESLSRRYFGVPSGRTPMTSSVQLSRDYLLLVTCLTCLFCLAVRSNVAAQESPPPRSCSKCRSTICSRGITNSNLWSAEI